MGKQDQAREFLNAGANEYIRYDSTLGWSINSNASDDIYQSNSIGARSNHEYSSDPGVDVVRFAAFGDSFTHADHVANHQTWSARWESLNPDVEVVNFGVPGYGTDQAYLRYLEKADQINADVVLIGIMSENINRNVNTYIPFYRPDSWPSTKPRFILDEQGELSLVENIFGKFEDYERLLTPSHALIEELGEHDYWYQSQLKPH